MWWQALPPLAAIGGLIAVPSVAYPVIQFIFTGRPTMRTLTEGNHIENPQRHGFRRDTSLFETEYADSGLDNITDDL